MHFKQPIIFALATLAFLTALGALSPVALLCGIFVVVCGLWAAVRMPPFWRYARQQPDPKLLAGSYQLRNKVPFHEEFSLELFADGTFFCQRFPLFNVWPPFKIEHAVAGYGDWQIEQESRAEWVLTLKMKESAPAELPGDTAPERTVPDIRHLQATFRLGRRGGGFALLTWVGGFVDGQTIEFTQVVAPVPSAHTSEVNSGLDC
jgi:hypothetical protein